MYAKDPFEAKYQWLINKRESIDLKNLNDSKAFIEHSNDMDRMILIKKFMNTIEIRNTKN